VVDEYDGATLDRPTTCTSAGPLSLGELASYFDRVWSIYDVLCMNFASSGFDAAEMQGFLVSARSRFYADVEELYRHRIDAWGGFLRRRLADRDRGMRDE
jgi:hypothetical protein